MLIHRLVVSPWQANCYLIQPGSSPDCVIVDPGVLGGDTILGQIESLGLQPVAVIGTHGHIDHVGDAHVVANSFDVPLYISEQDAPLLTHPGLALSPESATLLPQLLGGKDTLPEVGKVVTLLPQQEIGGLEVRMMPAPGHTKGSTILDVRAGGERFLISGDVIFAGSIGRTDFPGGSMTEMRESLRRIRDTFDGSLMLLPGHGPDTTLERELETNPYMQDSFLKVD